MTALQTLTAPADLEALRVTFADSLLNMKPASRATYSRSLKAFFTWADQTGRSIGNMTPRDVNAYREFLLSKVNADGSRASSLTATTYIMAVRTFFSWTEEQGLYPNVAAKTSGAGRDPKFQRRPLTEDQGRRLLAFYLDRGRVRDYALVLLMLQTGMRTAEIVNANVGGIKLAYGRVLLHFRGKRRDHDRDYVILAPETHRAIMDYLATRDGIREDEPLFTSQSVRHRNAERAEAMDTRTIRRIVEDGLHAIGLNSREYSAHSLRHTTAVTMLKRGADIEAVRAEMRHSSADTTRIYLREIEDEQRLERATSMALGSVFA